MITYKRYSIVDKLIIIDWKATGNDWGKIKDEVKLTLLAKFIFKSKTWQLPYSEGAVEQLRKLGYQNEQESEQAVANSLKITQFPDYKDVALNSKYLPKTIRGYQKEALQWLAVRDWKGIIALVPGLGKSLIGAIAGAMKSWDKPLLVITPATLKVHWGREFKQWSKLATQIIDSGYNPSKIKKHTEVLIVSMDILHKIAHLLKDNIGGIIIDEADNFSNPTIKRSIALEQLSNGIEFRILLTGTPARDKPADLHNLLNFVDGKYWKDRGHFLNRYCAPSIGYMGKLEYKGATHMDELYLRAKPYIFHRTLDELGTALPEQNVTITQMQVADDTFKKESDAIQDVLDAHGWDIDEVLDEDSADAEMLKVRLRIKELSKSAYFLKRPMMIDRIDSFLKDSDEQLVLVATHRAVMEDLKLYYGCDIIYGGISGVKRQQYVDDFNEEKHRVIVIQSVAGGVGFSLPKCRYMYLVEPAWSPRTVEQVMGRITRLTSVNKVSFYNFFVVMDTIEAKMIDAISRKSKATSHAITGKSVDLFGNVNYDEM